MLAEDILKEIIHAYNTHSIKEKNIRAMHTLTFIENRLHLVGADLDIVEHNIQQLKSDSLFLPLALKVNY
jgi:hypothetical protein